MIFKSKVCKAFHGFYTMDSWKDTEDHPEVGEYELHPLGTAEHIEMLTNMLALPIPVGLEHRVKVLEKQIADMESQGVNDHVIAMKFGIMSARIKVLERALEESCHYIDPCEIVDWKKFGKGSEFMNEFFIAQAEVELAEEAKQGSETK